MLLQKKLAKETSARERKMNIFRTLMATRSLPLRTRPDHVAALNTIAVEFHGDDAILQPLSAYLSEMKSKETGDDVQKRRDERFFELLAQISKALGYKHDKEYLTDTTYCPGGYADEWWDWYRIRKWAADIADGKKLFPVWIYEPQARPAVPMEPKPQAAPTKTAK